MTAASLPTPVGRQREVLYLPARGHTVVLGTAGSGKTTLAILRSLYLSDPSTAHGGRTLLVTFNRCLVTYMAHLAGTMQRPVDVRNYHRFARGHLGSRDQLPPDSICSPSERLRFIESVVGDAHAAGVRSPISQRATKFLEEEFQWIQRHGIGNEQDYVDAERTGRSTRVRRAERTELFDLYERYLRRRGQAGKRYDWDDLAGAVRRELADDEGERVYRHVVIYEGQDFSPEMLRSLAAVVPHDGSLTFFGDIAQQIYGHRMSWRSAGLNASKIWRFQENYRNTKQIARLALALPAMPHFRNDPDLVEPAAPAADGPRPVLMHRPSESAERELVVSRATDLARTGTVAVLFRTREQEAATRRYLPNEACTSPESRKTVGHTAPAGRRPSRLRFGGRLRTLLLPNPTMQRPRLRMPSPAWRPTPVMHSTAKFRRRLPPLLSNGSARPRRIEAAPGLLPLQARRWPERVDRGGDRATRSPAPYALTRRSLL